jgi:hypothetical protein
MPPIFGCHLSAFLRALCTKQPPAGSHRVVGAPASITSVTLFGDRWARQTASYWEEFMQSETLARTNEDWRELARRIQREDDLEKMVELVHELLAKLDDENLRRSPRPPTG